MSSGPYRATFSHIAVEYSHAVGTMTRAPRPRGRPRRLPVEEVRARTLDAAARAVADGGLAAATVTGIAALAGVDRSAVYEQFGSLDAVLAAATDRALERLRTTLLDSVAASAELPPRDLVASRIDAMLDFHERCADDAALIAAAERDGDLGLRTRVADAKGAVLAEFTAIRKEAWTLPADEQVHALEILTTMHWGMLESVIATWRSHPHWQRDHVVDLLTEFTVAGYGWLYLQRPELLLDPGVRRTTRGTP